MNDLGTGGQGFSPTTVFSDARSSFRGPAHLAGVGQRDNGHGAENALGDVTKIDLFLCSLLDALATEDDDHDEEVEHHHNGLGQGRTTSVDEEEGRGKGERGLGEKLDESDKVLFGQPRTR